MMLSTILPAYHEEDNIPMETTNGWILAGSGGTSPWKGCESEAL